MKLFYFMTNSSSLRNKLMRLEARRNTERPPSSRGMSISGSNRFTFVSRKLVCSEYTANTMKVKLRRLANSYTK
jgi:hypothetical protein